MNNFLLDYGINKDTINKIEKKYNQELLYVFNCNEYEIKKIIDYLKKINIICIDDILVDYIQIFLKTYQEFLTWFNKYDNEKLVKAINSDYHILDQILKEDS